MFYFLCLFLVAEDSRFLEVKKFDQAPVIDGTIEKLWLDSKPNRIFYLLEGKDKKTDGTELRLGYDSKWLYFALKCRVDDIEDIEETSKEPDGPLHADESVEIFIDPGTNGKMYIHYVLNSANVRAEKTVAPPWKNRNWNIPWRSSVSKSGSFWYAEIALPLYQIKKYSKGGQYRINVVRNNISALRDSSSVKVGTKKIHSSLAKVAKSFHDPETFIALNKFENSKPEKVPLFSVSEVKAGEYFIRGKQLYCSIFFDLENYSELNGKVMIELKDQSSERLCIIRESYAVDAKEKKKCRILLPCLSFGERNIQLNLLTSLNEEVLQSVEIESSDALKIMDCFFTRSYYTDEKKATLSSCIKLPELEGKYFVQVKKGNEILLAKRIVKQKEELSVPIENLKNGKHKIKINLCSQDGKVLFRDEKILRKLPPKAGFEWKTDRASRALLHDGKPFFPIGVFISSFENNKNIFKDLSDAGFNTVILFGPAAERSPDAYIKYEKIAAQHGLHIIGIPDYIYGGGIKLDYLKKELNEKEIKLGEKRSSSIVGFHCWLASQRKLSKKQRTEAFGKLFYKSLPIAEEYVEKQMNEPNLLVYFYFDEPRLKHMDQHIFGRELYEKIISIDGYHPCMVNYDPYGLKSLKDMKMEKEGTDWCDIILNDTYWTPGFESVNHVTKWASYTNEISRKMHKPFFEVLMNEYVNKAHKRILNKEEQLCQTWLAIICGARGIFYFRYPLETDYALNSLKNAMKYLRKISDISVNDNIMDAIKYLNEDFSPEDDKFPLVQACVKKIANNKYLVLAANSAPLSVNMKINIEGLEGIKKIKRLFKEKEFAVNNSCFSEKIEKYGVRAYIIEYEKKSNKNSLSIKISTEAETENFLKEEYISSTGRKDKKNIAINPSFEEETIEGLPDYYRGGVADRENIYEGKKSCRIEGKLVFRISPQVKKETDFTLSFYMKSDKEDTKALVCSDVIGYKNVFNINREWKRYSLTFKVPAKLSKYKHSICILIYGSGTFWHKAGTRLGKKIWIDAIQLEKGTKASKFEK